MRWDGRRRVRRWRRTGGRTRSAIKCYALNTNFTITVRSGRWDIDLNVIGSTTMSIRYRIELASLALCLVSAGLSGVGALGVAVFEPDRPGFADVDLHLVDRKWRGSA